MRNLFRGICDGGQGTQDRVPGEPPPTGTLELLAELELLWDRYSQLEEEVEALKNEAEHLGQQEALVRN